MCVQKPGRKSEQPGRNVKNLENFLKKQVATLKK